MKVGRDADRRSGFYCVHIGEFAYAKFSDVNTIDCGI